MSDLEQPAIGVKTAIQIARDYVGDLFSSDQIKNIGLEEVDFDDDQKTWKITIGFARPWDSASSHRQIPLHVMFPDTSPRTYKLVTISADDGKVLKVSNRLV